jgi:transcriptional regulator with GAF, ATPase, and Fis domain
VDLDSSNGSFVDGSIARAPLPLRDGAVVRLGPAALAVYESSAGVWAEEAPSVSQEALPGEAGATRLLRAKLAQVAADPSPVLLVGETGTGKELLAGEIHRLSGRGGRLVPVNCAALAPQLVESQLFGHVKGAFTGAHDAQPGLFREAQGGTLFLDEIGELPLDLQPKLLRAIQEREVQPVGSPRAVRVDVRVVAATNRDLAAEVEQGRFRRDLYARLSLWEVPVPPLRARRADLVMWIERLHRRWLTERGRAGEGTLSFDAPAGEALLLQPWPDNLRGVDRLVHALAAQPSAPAEPITLEQLPAWAVAAPRAPEAEDGTPEPEEAPAAARLPAPTREELQATLARFDGSVRATAKHYGRDRRQIYRWMEAFGIKER